MLGPASTYEHPGRLPSLGTFVGTGSVDIGWIVLEGSRLWYAQFDSAVDVALLANAVVR